jgi:hypothetical protein
MDGRDTDVWKKDGLIDTEWIVSAADACQDQLQTPPVPLSLVRQPPVQATDRPLDKVTADWCSNIVFKPDGELQQFIVWAPPIPVKVGQFKISEDFDHDRHRGTYAMQITYLQTRKLEFSESCLTSQGIRVSCPELGRRLGQFLAAEANIYSVRCQPPGPGVGGCNCDYELSFIGGPNGRWFSAAGSSQITFFDDVFGPPATADYCATDSSLELTGHDTTALFNQKALRTMRFQKPTCNDGIQSASLGETGVDCGGTCPPCGTCQDGIANGTEDGIDCGGNCLGVLCDLNPAITDKTQRKAACKDGVQEPWEEGLDCGGPCPNLCAP